MTEYLWTTVRPDGNGRFDVHGFDIYPKGSVLAGQYRKSFLDTFDSEERAQNRFPGSRSGGEFTDPGNTFGHLPDGPDLT